MHIKQEKSTTSGATLAEKLSVYMANTMLYKLAAFNESYLENASLPMKSFRRRAFVDALQMYFKCDSHPHGCDHIYFRAFTDIYYITFILSFFPCKKKLLSD